VGDSSTTELRIQAIKTVGLIGVVDVTVYHKHLISHAGVIDAFSNQLEYVEDLEMEGYYSISILLYCYYRMGSSLGEDLSPQAEKLTGEKKLSKIEKLNFSVVIRELMNVLKDSNLAQQHQSAASTYFKFFPMSN